MAFFFQELVNGITTGALYALVALGFTMVYGVLQLLNFAHGDLYMVGAYIGFFVIQWFGGPSHLTIAVPLLLVIMFVLAGGLVGGLGVSGDGVDQDDYVTAGGATGFEAPTDIRADQIVIDGVRLPFLKFPRNPTD